MSIKTIPVTEFQQNCRLIIDDSLSVCAVIDPGGNVNKILDIINEQKLQVSSIICTHAHLDHVGGVALLNQELCKQFGKQVPIFAHADDTTLGASVVEQARVFGLSPDAFCNVPESVSYVGDGDIIRVGKLALRVIHVPGHTPGHIALFMDSPELILFSGDTLFAGSVGRTDLPGGNHKALIKSIKEKLLVLPDKTKILSGHGPSSTIGRERISNPFLV